MRDFALAPFRAAGILVSNKSIMTAVVMVVMLLSSFMLTSCGRVAPSYEPGSISVTSTPAGAAIFFDGVDTEEVTPFDFTGLDANRYEISVVLDGYFPDPVSTTVDLLPAQHATRDFVLNNQAPTQLTVSSEPTGAAIFLDGEDTGETTPATIGNLEAGDVEVSLVLDGYYSSPISYTATVVANANTELAVGTFSFRSKKVVMMEGFSNVDCAGCPELATNVENLMHQDGYGLDRVLYCKFSMSWPGLDPHYQHNTSENNDRMNYYLNSLSLGIPMLTLDGEKAEGTSANFTPTSSEMATLIDTALQGEPGFLIDVTADFTNTTIPLTATLTAMEDVDLTGHSLYIALVQELQEYEEAPGSEGETEFHWLFRDRVDALPSLGSMTSGETNVINETVQRGEWDLDKLHVIAFVQNNATKDILQAGISTQDPSIPAALFLNNNNNSPTNEGIRP
ncbi:MAG: PEGA domain-containing protein [bacterium]|nr:PEGA domain-containing protein [bacterium]